MTLNEFLSEWNDGKTHLLVHTSGSTGAPKPLWVEKQRMLNSAKITCDFLGLRQGDTALLCMPLDYIAGKMMVVRSLERGLKLVCVPPSSHPLSDESLAQSGYQGALTFAAMVPLQVINSLEVPRERAQLMAIKHLIIGGGAVDEALSDALKDFPNAVWSTYGMTETLSHIALRRLNGDAASSWYEPFESVSVSKSDDDCLIINAPLVSETPLTTNDRVVFKQAPDGKTLFKILGRKDNVIDSGGVKIQIEEVETLLKPHLSQPFLITKQPDRKLGERVVLLAEGGNEAAIKALCQRYLPKYWQPKQILFVPKIPLTETGKPARALAERLAAERSEQEPSL